MIVFIIFILVGIFLFYYGRKNTNKFMYKFGIFLSILGLLLLISMWAGLIPSNDGITIQSTQVKKRTIIQTVSASGKDST